MEKISAWINYAQESYNLAKMLTHSVRATPVLRYTVRGSEFMTGRRSTSPDIKEMLQMFSHPMVRFTVCLAALYPFATQAEEEHWYNYDHLNLPAGTYIHYDPDDDHEGNRIFTSLEAVKSNDWSMVWPCSIIPSTSSPSIYTAARTGIFMARLDGFHAKITAGLIHGYKGEFKDKIPNNGEGIAPAIIPGIGYKKGRFGADIYVLGISGLLFTVGIDF